MKKIFYTAVCAMIVGALAPACNKKTAASTPGAAAKKYVEHIMNNDYEAFVNVIVFTEPVPRANMQTVNRAHASALRAIHNPDIEQRGGIREVRVVSEQPSHDNRECEVVLANHYNDGLVKTVNLHMVSDYDNVWKVRETPHKETWRAMTSEGDTEVIKVCTGHERDFIKDKNKDTGEKQFVKDINRHDGRVEVVKMLEDGQRHKEVIVVND